jgi:hypothetical protein
VLSHDCPISEASAPNLALWRDLASRGAYTLIVTKRSRHATNLPKAARDFKARWATTARTLLFEHVVESLYPSSIQVEETPYFIEPDITLPGQAPRPSLNYLVEHLLRGQAEGEKLISADILVAPAGLGKTTLSRALARRLLSSNREVIPILVESAQWQNLINLTLPNVLNAALLQLIPEGGRLTNARLFQVLVREQLLIPIFDGFDELCSHPNSTYNPATLIAELVELVGDAGAM